MEEKDITIYYPLKMRGEYVPVAYSFKGTLTAFSDPEDVFRFIKASFLTKEECASECAKLNKK